MADGSSLSAFQGMPELGSNFKMACPARATIFLPPLFRLVETLSFSLSSAALEFYSAAEERKRKRRLAARGGGGE